MMIDDVNDIIRMYDQSPHEEDERLIRHQLERELTLRCFEEYLPPQGAVLEIGAATGRYTVELASRGYSVTAVDFSAGLLDLCRERLAREGAADRVRLVEADARDLSALGEEGFDAALLMGPLYHLVEEEDRKTVIRQAHERLRTGGILLTAWISRLGILGDLLKNLPHWIEDQAEVRSVLELGSNPDNPRAGEFRGYFARASEIPSIHEGIGFETLDVVGVEPAISADDDAFNRLEGEQRRLWLDLLYEVSTEASTVGASRHILYVGKKRRPTADSPGAGRKKNR